MEEQSDYADCSMLMDSHLRSLFLFSPSRIHTYHHHQQQHHYHRRRRQQNKSQTVPIVIALCFCCCWLSGWRVDQPGAVASPHCRRHPQPLLVRPLLSPALPSLSSGLAEPPAGCRHPSPGQQSWQYKSSSSLTWFPDSNGCEDTTSQTSCPSQTAVCCSAVNDVSWGARALRRGLQLFINYCGYPLEYMSPRSTDACP